MKERCKNYYHRIARKIAKSPKGTHVHHKDGNPENNSQENLQVMSSSKHMRYHMKGRRHPEKTRWHGGEITLMRKLKNNFSNRLIAKMFKASHATINRIQRRDKYLCKEGRYV